MLKKLLTCTALLVAISGCTKDSFEKNFYTNPRTQWPTKLRDLPLNQQWSVYLYGVKTREPPPFELSVELAKHRAEILPIAIRTTMGSSEKTDLESVSTLLQMMREVVHYDACSYEPFRAVEFQKALTTKVVDGSKYACH